MFNLKIYSIKFLFFLSFIIVFFCYVTLLGGGGALEMID